MRERRSNPGGDRRRDPQLELARALTRSLAEAVFAVDRDGCLTFANPSFETLFGWTEEELLGQDVEQHIASRGLAARVMADSGTVRVDDVRLRRRDGTSFAAVCSGSPVLCDGEVAGACVTVSDVTEQSRVTALMSAEKRVLERIAEGAPLRAVLDELVRAVESQSSGLRVALLLFSSDRARLEYIAAPTLPEGLRDALCVTPGAAPPASAEETGSDGEWSDFSELALRHGLRGAMTTPIKGGEEEVLGVLHAYYPRVKVPPPEDIDLLTMAAHVARIAVDRHRAEAERLRLLGQERRAREENEEARGHLASILGSISDAFICIDGDWRYTFVNDRYARMVGAASADRHGPSSLWDDLPQARDTDLHYELEHALRDHVPVAFEAWSDDLERWLDVRAYPQQEGLAVSLQDISGRKALEDARDGLYLQLEGERGRLEAVVQQMPAAVVIFDADGHPQVENRRVTEVLGPAPPLSRDFQDGSLRRLIDSRPLEREDSPLRRALRGEKVMGLEVLCARHDGRDKVLRLSATPLRDARGQISGGVLVFYDITEQKRAEEAERFLARAGVELGTSLDYVRTLESLAWMAVPRMADWCTVDLVDDETGRVRCVAAAHVDLGRVSVLRAFKEQHVPDPNAGVGVAQVLRAGRTELHAVFTPDMAAHMVDEAPLALLRQVEICSLLVVPLKVHDRCVGALTFAMGESGRTYDEHDRRLAEELVYRAAFAYENARLHRETEQRARRARFLADVSRDLAASLRGERLLDGVVRALVEQNFDWCVVDVLDGRGEMAGYTFACADPAKEADFPGLRGLLMRSSFFPPMESLREERLIYAPDALTQLTDRAFLSADEAAALEGLGMGSFMVCPLMVRATTLGTLTVGSARRDAFARDDREFLEDLANRIALSLDNARLYHAEQAARLELDGLYARERDLVKTLGTSFLGDLPTGYAGLELAAEHRFALEAHRVGGDYYDFIPLDEHRLGVVVGDVCGKGIEASVITAAAKYLLRAYAYEDASPAMVLGRLNQALCREIRGGGLFVTLVYAVIDVQAATVTWGNAGHPPPVLFDGREGCCRRLDATGGIVGASADFTYGEASMPFEGSSVLALFTDGVSEACGALDPLGDGGVSEILLRSGGKQSAREVVEIILTQTIACAGSNPRDDLAIAVVAGRA